MLHRGSDAPAAAPRLRQLDEERHADRLVVEEEAVFLLAVIAQPLAVVGEQHDQRAVVEAEVAQALQQPAERPRRPRRSRRRKAQAQRIAPAVRRACAARRRGRTGRTAGRACPTAMRARRRACPRPCAGSGRRKTRPTPAGRSLSKTSKPWPMPVSLRSTYADTKPAEAQPLRLRSAGSSSSPGFTVKPTLSRTPCSNGSRPERMEACAGSVCGECE